jgi:predicted N-acetyltransferase YhbS
MTDSVLSIRAERTSDHDAVRIVHEAAFDNPGVARIVTDTRPTDRYVPELSLVDEGSALVRVALKAAEARHEPIVALLGSPEYYSRFGFVLASELGIAAPPGDPPEHFQAVPLRDHDASVRGTLFWHAAFTDDT